MGCEVVDPVIDAWASGRWPDMFEVGGEWARSSSEVRMIVSWKGVVVDPWSARRGCEHY